MSLNTKFNYYSVYYVFKYVLFIIFSTVFIVGHVVIVKHFKVQTFKVYK